MSEQLALLYVRVSTQMQVNDGMSLDMQERNLIKAAEEAGFAKYEILREEGRSGKSISGRPKLVSAMKRLETGEAKALFVTRIDRLARSTRDFLSIIDHSQKYHWRLVLLDFNLDTESASSRFVVTIMSALAEMERNIIASRQKDVHQDRRNSGKRWGIDLGPLPLVEETIVERIEKERQLGLSYKSIADGLNKDEIPTVLKGKKWYASTIRHIHLRGNTLK